jgi:hypothetical protein
MGEKSSGRGQHVTLVHKRTYVRTNTTCAAILDLSANLFVPTLFMCGVDSLRVSVAYCVLSHFSKVLIFAVKDVLRRF